MLESVLSAADAENCLLNEIPLILINHVIYMKGRETI